MIKITFTWLLLLCGLANYGQVVINEIDTDTPGTDDKEFIELKSATPNFALDGYVIVLYNGSPTSSTGNKSYFALDLDGYITDVNGLIVIGNDLVSPVPDKYLQVSTMQNGQDGIALYFANASDFPDQTPVTATNLVDAIVYGNNNPDATTLMSVLGVSAQINEAMNGLGTTQSIQRKNDGTYEVKTPTPAANNDGSGFMFNGVTIAVSATTINEGASFNVTFTTQTAVTSTLNFTFSLSGFTTADYTGNLSVSIPMGSNSYTTTIATIDDLLTEEDELVKVRFGTLPSGFRRMNDNIEIRVIDNDFTTRPYGTPLNPTYGLVEKQISPGYYDSLEGKTGEDLRIAIRDIVANPAVVHAQNYGDVEYMLKEADQNPLNSNEVWLMYVEQGRAKYKYQTTASNVGSWNREHIYPQSRGGFADATSSTPDGINVWLPTSADDITAGHADGHHIRSEDGPENTRRSNKDYGPLDYNGPAAGTQGSWHGDVARSLFYMACRYNLLNVVDGNPADTTLYQMGDLSTLLEWNHSDPCDDFETNHTNVIYRWQLNRNPFVDYPDLADYIWGNKATIPWHAPLATDAFSGFQVGIYPNPANDKITVTGLKHNSEFEIYNIAGAVLFKSEFSGETTFNLNLASGIYLAKITSDNKSITRKIIIR